MHLWRICKEQIEDLAMRSNDKNPMCIDFLQNYSSIDL